MNPQDTRFVPVQEVLNYVDRTIGHGVPKRTALKRAERKFGIDRGLIQAFVRSAQ